MKTITLEMTGDPFMICSLDGAVSVSIPIKIRRLSARCQVEVPQGISATVSGKAAPTPLQIALVRGHRWLRLIESGKVANLAGIAKMENVDRSYVSRMVNLTTLAPDIQAAILDTTLPDTVLQLSEHSSGMAFTPLGGLLCVPFQCHSFKSVATGSVSFELFDLAHLHGIAAFGLVELCRVACHSCCFKRHVCIAAQSHAPLFAICVCFPKPPL